MSGGHGCGRCLRCLVEAFAGEFGGRDSGRGVHATFVWLVEEIGELGEALLRGDRESLEEEVADVVAWVLSLAAMLGVDVWGAIQRKCPGVVDDCGDGSGSSVS